MRLLRISVSIRNGARLSEAADCYTQLRIVHGSQQRTEGPIQWNHLTCDDSLLFRQHQQVVLKERLGALSNLKPLMQSSAFSSNADSMLIKSGLSIHPCLMVLFARGLDWCLYTFMVSYTRVIHVIYWLIPKA